MKTGGSIYSIKKKIGYVIKKSFPKWQASRLYKFRFGRKINWKNPTEFNEKIRWLQFNTNTSKWSLLADKYRVREYLTQYGYGSMLVKLYAVWDKAEDIDFSILPNSFVIKTNNGYGSVFIVNNKKSVDLEEIRSKLKQDISQPFGYDTAEPHYLKIKPVVIAEELLIQDGDLSSSLIDYKFYCINGDPKFCAVMYNRNNQDHNYKVNLYDTDWRDLSNLLSESANKGNKDIPIPKNFELMKSFCHKMCQEFSFVRMDFYECNGKLYFGEFTFTPAACTGGSLGKDACGILSKEIHLPSKKLSRID